jgi:hypothetical protein
MAPDPTMEEKNVSLSAEDRRVLQRQFILLVTAETLSFSIPAKAGLP